ncbi:MAG: hypothetical protein ABIN01_24990 [Ferruginibacter sp.]
MKIITAIFLTLLFFAAEAQKPVKPVAVKDIATPGNKFTFKITATSQTSAGVFENDSILVRTLWSNVTYRPGTYTNYWDGNDDYHRSLAKPGKVYKIKVLTNNVVYTWQGTIGNSSTRMTGAAKHRGYYHCMRGLAFAESYGYFCTGYSEGSPSIAKFNIATPNEKIDIATGSTADANYVATDGTKVYWGAFDSFSDKNSFVFATSVGNEVLVKFTNGLAYTPTYRSEVNVISYVNAPNSLISGLTVQRKGSYLFVARRGIGQLQVLNKATGALVQTLAYNDCKALCVDASDNLWMAQGSTVSKYQVNNNGTLSAAILTLSGLVDPLATQVSNDGKLITVTDGGRNQQVKFFNNSSGILTNTLGVAGGYFTDATVNDNKFYFSDARTARQNPALITFIAYQADGSFWVADPGNSRVQHYNSSRTFIDRVMWLGSTYSTWVDRTNINRVFAYYWEFAVDYSVQTLTGAKGWSLVKNWGANVTSAYDGFVTLKYQTTLRNGRTYGMMRKGSFWEMVELPSTGTMRFTGIFIPLSKILCSDGSLQDHSEIGLANVYQRFPLTGFDGSRNPQWSSTGETLAFATNDPVTGSPATTPSNQIFSTTSKVVLFNPNIILNKKGPAYVTGYHLGVMERGAKDEYVFQTERATHRNYQGSYPAPGWFDIGNNVNDFAGGNVNIVDRNIITSYHGEFWKDGQTNKYNHYYDNGLAIGQFGTTRKDVGFGNHAAPMMAGNALSPVVVKDAKGDLYLWHGDESDHSGIHRWKITGLNTIAEQTIIMSSARSAEAYAVPVIDYVDLMAGLPFDTMLPNKTGGWTRSPATNNADWHVNTSRLTYADPLDTDLKIDFGQSTPITNTVSRDLGKNNVTTSWSISGYLAYPDNAPNYGRIEQYLKVLDDAGKVLTTFYPTRDYSAYPTVTTQIKANTITLATGTGNSITSVMNNFVPFTISVMRGAVTFIYGNYKPVTTTIFDATANWRSPATLQCQFITNNSNYPAYGVTIDLYQLKYRGH